MCGTCTQNGRRDKNYVFFILILWSEEINGLIVSSKKLTNNFGDLITSGLELDVATLDNIYSIRSMA
jgi:hypothetical protein